MTGFPSLRLPDPQAGPGLRWGVIGPGWIAGSFVEALHAHTRHRVTAVASRSGARATAFAERHGIPAGYEGTDRLLASGQVDVVYVATPNHDHLPTALAVIDAGLRVLIEKPLALTADEARRIAEAARRQGVLAMEAMWSRYTPRSRMVDRMLELGALGEVLRAGAAFGTVFSSDPGHRSRDPRQGGGALLDIGVYPIAFARSVLGSLTLDGASGTLAPTGVEDDVSFAVVSDAGVRADLSVTMRAEIPSRAYVSGESGVIELDDKFFVPGGVRWIRDGTALEWDDPSGLSGSGGLAWQAVEVGELRDHGALDSPRRPLDQVIADLALIDDLRARLGTVPYPGEHRVG